MMRITFLFTISCILGLFVSSALAVEGIEFDFHGNMLQVVGSTNNSLGMAGEIKSGKTDFFSYNGALNTKGTDTYGFSIAGKAPAYYDNYDSDKTDYMRYLNTVGTTYGLSKARLRFEARTKDKLAKFVYGLEVGTVNWGDQSKKFGLSGDGVTQESRYAYAEIKAPLDGISHVIRAGLQPTKINHWVWTETAAGLTYHGKSPSCKWMVGWYRGDENTKSNSTDNNYFVLKASGPLSPELELGLFMVYEHAGAEETSVYEPKSLTPTELEIDNDKYDRKIYYLGTTLALDSQPFTGKFEIIYQGGDISFIDDDIDDLERGAMLIHMDMGFQVNQQLKVGVNSLYVSGDDNPNDQDANNFDAIDVDVKVGMMLFKNHLVSSCDRFVSDAPYILDKGLMHHALTADYKLNKKHSFFTAIRRLALTKDIADESDLGMELDFKYAYKFNKYVKLRLESACLLPGGASDLMTADGQDADTNVTVAAGIQFKF